MSQTNFEKLCLSKFFKNDTLSRIGTYVKHLQKIVEEYDIVVLMARKAICFFDALLKNGEININNKNLIITTNRVFTYKNEHIKNKKIIIIDDVLVTGNTLRNTINEVSKISDDFDVFFLACEKGFKILELPKNEKLVTEPLVLTEQDILDLSNSITNYIAASACSYNIDYPTFFASISDDEFLSIKKQFDLYEIKSILQNIYDIEVNVQSIKSKTNDALFDLLPQDNLLMKIRLFYDHNREENNLSINPIVFLGKLSYCEIDRIYEYFSNPYINDMNSNEQYIYENKYKWLQYVIAYKLFYSILQNIDFLNWNKIEYSIKRQNWVFPCLYENVLNETLKKNNISFNIRLDSCYCSIFDLSQAYAWFLNFLQNYHESDPNHKNHFTFEDIINNYELSSEELPSNIKKIFSNIFDISIDKGIIVPLTENKNGEVYRAYRLGEQYKLTNNHYDLFVYMLSKFTELNDSHGSLEKTVVEKLLVLFFKKVIDEHFVDISDDKISSDVYSVHYTRFGPVVSSGETIYEVEGGELSDKLTIKPSEPFYFGCKKLKYNFKNRKYDIPVGVGFNDLKQDWVRSANNFSKHYYDFSKIFEKVSSKSSRIKTFGKYLTLKAIGHKLENQYLSLLAEIKLFQNKYQKSKRNIINGFLYSMSGLISGAWKYICYKENSFNQINKAIRKFYNSQKEYSNKLGIQINQLENNGLKTDYKEINRLQIKKFEIDLFFEKYLYVFDYIIESNTEVISEDRKNLFNNRMDSVGKLICELLQIWNKIRQLCVKDFEILKSKVKDNKLKFDFDINEENKSYIATLQNYTGCNEISFDNIDEIQRRLDEISCETESLISEYDKVISLDLKSKVEGTIVVIKNVYNDKLAMPSLKIIKDRNRIIENAFGIEKDDDSMLIINLSNNKKYWDEILECPNCTVLIFDFYKNYNKLCLNTHGQIVNERFKKILEHFLEKFNMHVGVFKISDIKFDNAEEGEDVL